MTTAMALQLVFALCSVALLSTLALGLPVRTEELKPVPIKVTVKSEFSSSPPYLTSVLEGGVLFGALNNLNSTNSGFSVSVNPTYGLFLESVNGLAGSEAKRTFWLILSEHEGNVVELDVGIGCYQPRKDEHIILKYTTWHKD